MSDEPRPTPRPGRPVEATEGRRRPTPRPDLPTGGPPAGSQPNRGAARRAPSAGPDGSTVAPRDPLDSQSGRDRSGTRSKDAGGTSKASGDARRRQPTPLDQAAADHRKRMAAILAVGSVIILVGVGVLLQQWSVAIGGCIGWIVIMLWSARKDRAASARR